MADSMASGQIGRQLPRLFRTVGFTDVHWDTELLGMPLDIMAPILQGSLAAALSNGLLDPADADAFWKSVEIAQGREALVAFLFFIVSGMKA